MTFGINEKGEPFFRVQILHKTRSVQIKTEEGFEFREIRKDPTYEDVSPENRGWAKIVKFEEIALLMLPNPKKHYKLTPSLWHRTYEINVKDYVKYNPCSICTHNGIGSKLHYLRVMPAGVYHVCWLNATKFGRSASGPIRTMTDIHEGSLCPWVKLLSEKKISKAKARLILKRLQRKPSLRVAMHLEGHTVLA